MPIPAEGRPITRAAPPLCAAMDGDWTDRLCAPCSTSTLGQMRTLLAVGAAPLSDAAGGDEVHARAATNPGGLAQARALLAQGPSGYVERIEELYDAGLPKNLPGGLAAICTGTDREELVVRVRAQRRLADELKAARSSPSVRRR